jgi:hypothetical protein
VGPTAERAASAESPRASSDVKDAHTACNARRAQNERHEVSRNVRKGSVVLGTLWDAAERFSGIAQLPRRE